MKLPIYVTEHAPTNRMLVYQICVQSALELRACIIGDMAETVRAFGNMGLAMDEDNEDELAC